MPKLWIGDKMYFVDNDEVRDYCEKLEGRITKLEAALSRIKYHTKNALYYYKANKPKEMMGAFEQALKGG